MAWYRTGTVAVANGGTTVTGTGTLWNTNAKVGDGWQGPDSVVYEILTVTSNLELELATPYLGTTVVSGGSYAIVPTQSSTRDLVTQAQALVGSYNTALTTALAGKFGAGSAAAPGVAASTDVDTGLAWLAANVLGLIAGGAEVARASAAGLTASKVGVNNTAPVAQVHVGNGSSASLGSSPPLVWVSARASSDGGAVTPQELLRLSWQEGSQDLFAGEGAAIAFAASLAGDAGTFYPVVRIASRKESNSDTVRASSLALQVSSDGTAAPTDALVIGADGVIQAVTGIKFGAGTAVLGSYEEGTFTPVVADVSSGGNVGTATIAQGGYTKVGKTVTVTVLLSAVVTTGMTSGGDFVIRGLPFVARSTPNSQYFVGAVRLSNFTFTGFISAILLDGTSYIRLAQTSSGGGSPVLSVADCASGAGNVWLSLTYDTDA